MNELLDILGTTDLSQPSKPAPAADWSLVLGVAAVATLIVFSGLGDEPHFADESAMIAQSYYYTLFKKGDWNHPDWLHYAAFDHPPLPKYFFGLSLDLAGLPVPTSIEAWQKWMLGDFSPPADRRVLYWARVPSALFGVAGAVALYMIGLQLHGRVVGVLASMLCVLNPLYLTHARRAMSDSFCECLVITAAALALWGCRLSWESPVRLWRWGLLVLLQSLVCGLAALAKLNGGIATVLVIAVLGASSLLLLAGRAAARPIPPGQRVRSAAVPLAAALAIALGSFMVFVLLNPFMTAHPPATARMSGESRKLAQLGVLARGRFLVEFRRDWTVDALMNPAFEKDWLPTTSDRLRMTLWEGLGRFSPLGPRDIRTVEPRPARERFSDYYRASCLLWFPLVLAGILLCLRDGWRAYRSGRAPIAWGVLAYAAITVGIVVGMIPLNWDRYYLPIQAPAAVLASFFAVQVGSWWERRTRPS